MLGNMAERKAFLREAFSWPDLRITASGFVKSMFEKNGFREPILVQPYGHDLGWLANYHGKGHSDLLRIGYIGQMIEAKGVHLLIEALKTLYEEVGESFHAFLYGSLDKDRKYGEKLIGLVGGREYIEFAGTYAHEESSSVFGRLDVLVVPSLWYDFPLVIYEAFATGTPVVASNLAGMGEAVNPGVNGLLFEPGSVEDLTRQLRQFFDQPDLLSRLRDGMPEVKAVGEEVSQLEELYSEMLSSTASR